MNKIHKIGIIGSGKMGSDIFNYLTDYAYNLIWFTRNTEHQLLLRESFDKKIKRQLKHGIINDDIFELRNNFKITTQLSDLSDCDLIIESVIEDQSVKTEVFDILEKIVKPSCIIVSNSSSIVPSVYSQNLSRKNRIAGIHFFYPMAIKNVSEIIFSDITDDLTRESIRLFLDSINRFYIEQEVKTAFILNRFLLEIQIKAYELRKNYKIGFNEIDEIAKSIIPDFGLFEMMDMVGHHTMYNSILNYSLMDKDKQKYKPLLTELNHRLENKESGQLAFCNEIDFKETVNKEIQNEIQIILKDYSKEMLIKYTNDFVINIYTFKKALNEFCGIML